MDARDMNRRAEEGFTLIEMMATMVIALVILAGLMLSFISQYGEYKYQNKRVDAVQDLELGVGFVANDLRSALVGSEVVTITNNTSSPYETTDLNFKVWAEDTSGSNSSWSSLAAAQGANFKAERHYQYDAANRSLKYDRNIVGADAPQEILGNVTYFKVFVDTPGVKPTGPGGIAYADAPVGLPGTTIVNGAGDTVTVNGLTLLIEIAVRNDNKRGQKRDVMGNVTQDKRIWRYIQVYPKAAI